MVNPPLTIWMADCPSQASGGMAPRAPSGSMTMATRSGPAAGDLSLSEIRDFAGFPEATQRYFRRSLDIGLEPNDAIVPVSRSMGAETAITVMAALYHLPLYLRPPIPTHDVPAPHHI